MEKKVKKYRPFVIVSRAVMLILTAVYPLIMTFLSGAGIIYNSESYGKEVTQIGIMLVISSVLMTTGAFLCLSGRKIPNILSIIFSVSGIILCMTMLYKLCSHADYSGWNDKFTMNPISDMYKMRILPCFIPVLMSLVTSALNLMVKKKFIG